MWDIFFLLKNCMDRGVNASKRERINHQKPYHKIGPTIMGESVSVNKINFK